MNNISLLGRLTADAEIRTTQSDKSVASFTIAVNKQGKDAGADFIDCVAWEKTAEFISRYFKKGDSIAITGALHTRSYEDKDGKRRKVTEVTVDRAYFTGNKKESNEPIVTTPPMTGDFELVDSGEDLPF